MIQSINRLEKIQKTYNSYYTIFIIQNFFLISIISIKFVRYHIDNTTHILDVKSQELWQEKN